MTLRRPLVVLVALVAGGAFSTERAPSARGADRPVVTVTFGDSFAAGEGLPDVDPGEAECQRALGHDAEGDHRPSKAWGITVLESLDVEQSSWFAACTSARSEHFMDTPQDTRTFGFGVLRELTQYDEAARGLGTETFDVVLASFGGNDLGFGEVILDCVGIDEALAAGSTGARAGGWGGGAAGAGLGIMFGHCSEGLDGELRDKINDLVVPNLRTLYDQLATATRAGSLIVITGYPQVVEEPSRWSLVNRLTRRCHGITRDDAPMLRGIAGRLNEVIGAEVLGAAQRHPDRTWAYADVSATFADHGLCSSRGDQWLNGLTTGLSDGDFRLQRSFHPTQVGHDAYARVISGLDEVERWEAPDIATAAEAERTGPGEYTIRFVHPTWGPVRLMTHANGDDGTNPGPAWIRVVDDRGMTRFSYDNEFLYELGPMGTGPYAPEDAPPSPIDATGNIFLDFNPGRYNGVIVLRPTADGFDDLATLPPSDGYNTRFYSAYAVDADGDGAYEIETEINDCMPYCAAGTTHHTIYRWDGNDYVADVDESTTLRFDGVGPLVIGMSEDAARATGWLGTAHPDWCDEAVDGTSSDTGYELTKTDGFAVFYDGTLSEVMIRSGETEHGIGVGDRADDMVRTYEEAEFDVEWTSHFNDFDVIFVRVGSTLVMSAGVTDHVVDSLGVPYISSCD